MNHAECRKTGDPDIPAVVTVAMDMTWGELERLYQGCGYIVVG